MDEVRQSLEPKMARALANYQLYKETHDAVLQIPFVKHLLETQCACKSQQATQSQIDPIQLEIIDVATEQRVLPNLDSIAEYLNNSAIKQCDFETDEEHQEETDEEEEEAEEEEEEVQEEEETNVQEEEEEEAVQEEEEEEEEEVHEEEAEEEVQEEEETNVQEEEETNVQEEEVQEESEAEEKVQESAEAEAEETNVQEEAESAEEEEEEEEELELFEVEIKGKTYVTNDETEGDIYAYVNNEVGEIVGEFKNGVAKLFKKSKPKST